MTCRHTPIMLQLAISAGRAISAPMARLLIGGIGWRNAYLLLAACWRCDSDWAKALSSRPSTSRQPLSMTMRRAPSQSVRLPACGELAPPTTCPTE